MFRTGKGPSAAMTILATIASGCVSATSASYKFEVVGQPVFNDSDSALAVQLVNVANGQPVSNAEIAALPTRLAPNYKGQLAFRTIRVPLKSDGHGDFLYEAGDLHPHEILGLVARVPGEGSLI